MLNNIEKLDLNTLAHVCGGQTTKRHPKKRSGRVANSTGDSSLLSWIGNICFIGCAAYVIIDLFKRCFGGGYITCPGYTATVIFEDNEAESPCTGVFNLPVYIKRSDLGSARSIASVIIYTKTLS